MDSVLPLSSCKNAALCEAIFENATEGIVITDAQAIILKVNAAFAAITGYSRQEVIGQNPRLLQSGRHAPSFYASMWESLELIGQWQGEISNRRKDGTIYPERLSILRILDGHGQVSHYVGIFTDLTLEKEDSDFFKYVATHDQLTDLPNRSHFYDRLNQAVYRAKMSSQRMAVLFIDLDGFKQVNDRFGHETGDQVLIEVADLLVECVREKEQVARMGGDEFTVIQENIAGPQDAAQLAETILQRLSTRTMAANPDIHLTASIGISLFPDGFDNTSNLLSQADQAMYQTKEVGKNGYKFFRYS